MINYNIIFNLLTIYINILLFIINEFYIFFNIISISKQVHKNKS